MTSFAPAHPEDRSARWLLTALLLWSFALRAVFAAGDLEPGRFYDERYTFANVRALLVAGEDWPANAFYPSLTYLPQTALLAGAEALYRWTGAPALAVFTPSGETFSPFAYYLCRLVQAIYGTLSILFTFLVGRRLFSPTVALLGAFLLSVVPDHLRLSVFFKPDILLTWLVLVVFLWSLEAALSPTAGRLLRVGLGVGLATAAKYTGVVTALPITLEIALRSWRRRRLEVRPWLWLAASGALAFAVFASLNPDLRQVLADYARISRAYVRNAPPLAGGRLGVLAAEAGVLLVNHGPWISAAALAGLVLLAVGTLRRSGDSAAEVGRRMLLEWVLGFSLLYAAVTSLPKGNNYLPLLPFTALAAAWVLVRLGGLLARPLPRLRHPGIQAAAVAALVLYLSWPIHRWVYDVTVPSTHSLAEEHLARRLGILRDRVVIWERDEAERSPTTAEPRQPPPDEGGLGDYEAGDGDEERRPEVLIARGRQRAAAVVVDHLPEVGADSLDLADAEVFPLGRLDGATAAFYLERLIGAGPGRKQVMGGGSRLSRGEPKVVLLHPWRLTAPPRTLELHRVAEEPGVLEAELPADLAAGTGRELALSLHLGLPREVRAPEVEVDGQALRCFRQRARRTTQWYLTPRLRPPAQGSRVRLGGLPEDLEVGEVRLEAVAWAAPEGAQK